MTLVPTFLSGVCTLCFFSLVLFLFVLFVIGELLTFKWRKRSHFRTWQKEFFREMFCVLQQLWPSFKIHWKNWALMASKIFNHLKKGWVHRAKTSRKSGKKKQNRHFISLKYAQSAIGNHYSQHSVKNSVKGTVTWTFFHHQQAFRIMIEPIYFFFLSIKTGCGTCSGLSQPVPNIVPWSAWSPSSCLPAVSPSRCRSWSCLHFGGLCCSDENTKMKAVLDRSSFSQIFLQQPFISGVVARKAASAYTDRWF